MSTAAPPSSSELLIRTASIPPLEVVASPPRQLPHAAASASSFTSATASSSSSPAAAAAPASTPPDALPVLHDELQSSFSGELLNTLQHLGVSAYSTSDVEQTVIARALQAEQEAEQARHSAAQRRRPDGAAVSSSLKRKRIPKKVGTSIAAASLLSSASPLPVPERVVHHDDPVTASGALSKQRLEEALAIGRGRQDRRGTDSSSSASRTAARPRPPAARTLEEGELVEDAGGAAVETDAATAAAARQRLIDQGEVTPFHAMTGVETGYRRVSRPADAVRQQLASSAAASAASPAVQRDERKDDTRGSRINKGTPAFSRAKQRPRAATPSIPSSTGIKARSRTSATPPPAGRGERDETAASAEPPAAVSSLSAGLEVSELPVRLTRARLREEQRSVEEALRRSEREARRVKEEEVLVSGAGAEEKQEPEERGAAESDVQLMEEEDEEMELRAHGDEDWKGDAESSSDEEQLRADADEEDDEEAAAVPLARRSRKKAMPSRRRLMKPDDAREGEEVDEVEAEERLLDDDDDDAALSSSTSLSSGGRIVDDFLDDVYEERLAACRHSPQFANEVRRVEGRGEGEVEEESLDVAFDGGYVLPGRVWDRLFGYQKTAIKWLWELHLQQAGGIVADEMGLGKTVQMAAFLAGLHYSNAIHKHSSSAHTAASAAASSSSSSPFLLPPTLVLCPATIMTQWLREFHSWYPELRVLVLHDSVQSHHGQGKEAVLDRLFSSAHVLITTYECARLYRHLLLHREWGYCVLDEGHKIRNPDAAITLTCKQLLSVHRIIMTGAPIQNNLIELWSLFDFVFPGKLGTLPVFEDEFALPINQGGFTNASQTQVQLAYRCAAVLREIINPYVLRRNKADVAQHLPKKTEQILFVNLTPAQRDVYKAFLNSDVVQETIDGRGSLFKAIHVLRKICNHPDLLLLKERSGKLQVVSQILSVWHAERHRVLLFAQTRQMLDILESFVSQHYSYHRIDGLTSIRSRLPLIDSFNSDPSVFCFLLTTKAGGLGVNLTGADRVLLYDPDWNPSTDLQARERSWRIGQRREVVVYRLLVRGSIEEKIYHRQIFKQFLTAKVLSDPKQRRFFTRRDMKDLFSLDEGGKGETETARVFRDVAEEVYADQPEQDTVEEEKKEQQTPSVDAESASVQGKRRRLKKEKDGADGLQPVAFAVEAVNEDTSDAAALAPSSASSQSDNRILSLLFSKGGVTSAMDHDSIMEGSSRAERSIAETIARRVAEKAVEALRRSREGMQHQPLSVPTWTGRNGGLGADWEGGEKKRFGTVTRPGLEVTREAERKEGERPMRAYNDPTAASTSRLFDHHVSGYARPQAAPASSALPTASSSAVLARLKQRSEQGLPALSSSSPSAHSQSAIEERDAVQTLSSGHLSGLLEQLVSVLSDRQPSGGCSTQELVEAFSQRLRSDADKYVFRQLLREVAVMQRDRGSGEGRWTLKR